MNARIVDLEEHDADRIDQLAHILLESFTRFSPDWLPTLEDAIDEVTESFEPGRLSRVLVNDADDVLGWIGAFEDEHAWEIHPIVVAPDQRRHGFGAMLVADILGLARDAGASVVWAGTSDETGATSLSSADLYRDPLGAMAGLTAEPDHPVHFWRAQGFTLVGVLPDNEGPGKPGLHFAKALG